MCLKNTAHQYGRIAKIFHWLTALLIFGMLPLGFYMVWLAPGPLKFDLYQLHKSIGMTILLLVILRIGWKLSNPKPKPPETLKKWELVLSRLVHGVLYLTLFFMPLTGWLLTSASEFPNKYFGLFDIPDLVGKDEGLYEAMSEAHEVIAFIILGAVFLHIAGALKHYFVDRDQTLQRMLPPSLSPYFGPIVYGIVFVTFLVFALTAVLIYQTEIKPDSSEENVKTLDSAAMTAPPAKETAQSGWQVLKTESEIGFTVDVYGKPFSGVFKSFSGNIKFDPARPEEADVTVSVEIDSVESGNDERDGYIVEPAWLNAQKYPRASVAVTDIKKEAEGQFYLYGDLTLKGVTRKIEMPFSYSEEQSPEGLNARAKGAFMLKRQDFGIGAGQWASGQTVGEDVEVSVRLHAFKP